MLWVAKAAAKSGASVETEPSIRPARPGCTILQHEHAALGRLLLGSGVARHVPLGDLAGLLLVAALDVGEARQQFADRDVQRLGGGLLVEAGRLHLHDLGLLPHLVDGQVLGQPDRAAGEEALDVLAADRRQVLAELLAVEPVQHAAVAALLLGHVVEDGGRMRIGLAQLVGEGLVDAEVFLLAADGESQDLAFGQVGEGFQRHGGAPGGDH